MSTINQMMREQLGLAPDAVITFNDLDDVLEKMALRFPFENLRIINKQTQEVTKAYLIDKMLVSGEGGLCYELNPMLYFFLQDNGFQVQLLRGTVYNSSTNQWSATRNTHVGIVLQHEGQDYLLDTGFGGNLPLKPVPFNGQEVTSMNGCFRVRPIESDMGNYVYECKLRYKDDDWRTGYVFNTKHPVKHMSEMDDIQTTIIGNEHSHFNKRVIITRLTTAGNMTLTTHSFTQWINGEELKEDIDERQYHELARQHFGLNSTLT